MLAIQADGQKPVNPARKRDAPKAVRHIPQSLAPRPRVDKRKSVNLKRCFQIHALRQVLLKPFGGCRRAAGKNQATVGRIDLRNAGGFKFVRFCIQTRFVGDNCPAGRIAARVKTERLELEVIGSSAGMTPDTMAGCFHRLRDSGRRVEHRSTGHEGAC